MKYILDGVKTERLSFRKLREADYSVWLEFCKDPKATQYVFLGVQGNPEELCRLWFDRVFYRYANNEGGMNVLINTQTGEFVGQCALQIQRVDGVDELEVGYSLLPDQWGCGYATEAAMKCRDEAFEKKYTDRLISIIHKDNTPSIKVALKNGMILEKETVFKGCPVQVYSINIEKWNLISKKALNS